MLAVEGLVLKFPSEDNPEMISKICHPQNVMIRIEQDLQVLTVYEKIVPRVGFYYAIVKSKQSSIQHCIARAINTVDEAVRIYGLLIKCQHPHCLKPTGLWICHNDKDEGSGKKGVRADEAFITFPLIDGVLVDVPTEDLFLLEEGSPQSNPSAYAAKKEEGSPKPTAHGITNQGSRIFCDILGAVRYINGLYGTATGITSDESSSHHTETVRGALFLLCPLRFGIGQIVYKMMSEGEYQVLLLVDFLAELPVHLRRKTSRGSRKEVTVDDIKEANWAAIGTCLSTICRSYGVKFNMELEHFAKKLSEKSKKGPMLNYNDIVWEPGLWPAHIKISFIREVFWCIDNSKAKEDILKSKNSLGLKGCIKKLGFGNNDANLLDSVTFLRKKVVAHQDSSYESYTGDKGDVGRDKTTIEAFIKKNKPDYMINLAKEVRLLNWMESPLTRSKTTYVQMFKPPSQP